MVRDLRDHRDLGPGARQDHGVDPLHVRRHERNEGLDAPIVRVLFFEGYDYAHVKHSRLPAILAGRARCTPEATRVPEMRYKRPRSRGLGPGDRLEAGPARRRVNACRAERSPNIRWSKSFAPTTSS